MEKPIVFLSHSSKDKEPLAAIKSLLDERAAGSLDFFLSSDGQSIRFGRNWVVRVSDALARAKLMFIFLSPNSEDSRWIHFEAGCAYSKDVQVVPVCLGRLGKSGCVLTSSLSKFFDERLGAVVGILLSKEVITPREPNFFEFEE